MQSYPEEISSPVGYLWLQRNFQYQWCQNYTNFIFFLFISYHHHHYYPLTFVRFSWQFVKNTLLFRLYLHFWFHLFYQTNLLLIQLKQAKHMCFEKSTHHFRYYKFKNLLIDKLLLVSVFLNYFNAEGWSLNF